MAGAVTWATPTGAGSLLIPSFAWRVRCLASWRGGKGRSGCASWWRGGAAVFFHFLRQKGALGGLVGGKAIEHGGVDGVEDGGVDGAGRESGGAKIVARDGKGAGEQVIEVAAEGGAKSVVLGEGGEELKGGRVALAEEAMEVAVPQGGVRKGVVLGTDGVEGVKPGAPVVREAEAVSDAVNAGGVGLRVPDEGGEEVFGRGEARISQPLEALGVGFGPAHAGHEDVEDG